MISRDFSPEHKNREKRVNFTKSVIYRDQNLRSFQTIGTMSARWYELELKTAQKLATIVHFHGIASRVLFWMAVLSLLTLVYEPCFQHET